jgi:hypothetical protein
MTLGNMRALGVHCHFENEFRMAIEQATRHELAQLVNVELERLGIYVSHVQVYPSPEDGWTATVMAKPARLVEYQAFTDEIVTKFRERYALKD